MTKRLFDVAASVIGLVVLAPVMGVIAVLVKRDSEGPALFKQERVGLEGRLFTLFKFRSMTVTRPHVGPLVTTATDVRITRLGAKLRATKLDELPQLFNVVRGDMSLVGPRPEVSRYVEMWSVDDRRVILSVRPGITDPATLALRREEELLAEQPDPEQYYQQVLLPQKVRLYRHYVESRSLRSDIALILRTISRVIAR